MEYTNKNVENVNIPFAFRILENCLISSLTIMRDGSGWLEDEQSSSLINIFYEKLEYLER